MDYHIIVFVLIALYWVGIAIVRFFRWLGKQAVRVSAGPAPIQQTMAEAREQQALPQQAIPQPQQAAPPQMPPRASLRSRTPWEMPRQPEAGGAAVPREATSRDFQMRELDLLTEEPGALNARLQSEPGQAAPPSLRLFETNDDLIRAFILQEALGLPLSRKPR